MTLGRLSLALMTSLTLAGCATSNIGQPADYVGTASGSAPLDISASFNPALCSNQIGYLAFSVTNPSSDFYTLDNAELHLPEGHEQQFHVLAGRELIAWADAQNNLTLRNQHNTNLARLAAVSVARLMADSSNDNANVVGAGIGAITAADMLTEEAEKASIPAGTSSNHLYEENLMVPPGMDRTFWVALQAKPNAPLLTEISVSYTDAEGKTQRFSAELNKWQNCEWQQQRIADVRKWGAANGLIRVGRQTGGGTYYMAHDLLEVAEKYQQQHEMASNE